MANLQGALSCHGVVVDVVLHVMVMYFILFKHVLVLSCLVSLAWVGQISLVWSSLVWSGLQIGCSVQYKKTRKYKLSIKLLPPVNQMLKVLIGTKDSTGRGQ